MLLINLDYWRNNDFAEKIITFISNSDPRIFERWDQDALNAVCDGKWKRLPLHYNTNIIAKDISDFAIHPYYQQFTKNEIIAAQDNIKILHYTGFRQHKPWFYNTLNPRADLYLRYLNMTPFKVDRLPMYSLYREALFDKLKFFPFSNILVSIIALFNNDKKLYFPARIFESKLAHDENENFIITFNNIDNIIYGPYQPLPIGKWKIRFLFTCLSKIKEYNYDIPILAIDCVDENFKKYFESSLSFTQAIKQPEFNIEINPDDGKRFEFRVFTKSIISNMNMIFHGVKIKKINQETVFS